MIFKNAKVIGENIDPEIYHKRDETIKRGNPEYVMSQGELKEFLKCPSRWVNGYREDQKSSEAQKWGSLIDCLVLTPDRFKDVYCVAPETYPAEGKKKGDPATEKPWNWNATYCKEWRESQNGLMVLKAEEIAEAGGAIKKLYEDATITAALTGAKRQVMVTADAHINGLIIPVRVLIDFIPELLPYTQMIGDLKTACDASIRGWQRAVFTNGYHIQGAFYIDIYEAATSENRTDFIHVIQESFLPYQTGRRILSSELLELGREEYKKALFLYAECLKTGIWPDYEEGTAINSFTVVEPEAWMIK